MYHLLVYASEFPLQLFELVPGVLLLTEEAESLALLGVLVAVVLHPLLAFLEPYELVLQALPLGAELDDEGLQVGEVLVYHLHLVAALLDHELQQVVDGGVLGLHVLEADVELLLLGQYLVAAHDGVDEVPVLVVEPEDEESFLRDVGEVHEVVDELLLAYGEVLAAGDELLEPFKHGGLPLRELWVGAADVPHHPLQAVDGHRVLPVEDQFVDAVLYGALRGDEPDGVHELDGLVDPLVDLVLDAADVEAVVLIEPGAAVDYLLHLLLELLGVVGVGLDEVVLVDLGHLFAFELEDVLQPVQHLQFLFTDLGELLHLLQVALEGLHVGVDGVVDLDHAEGVDSVIGETHLCAYAAHEVSHVEVHEDVDHLHDHLIDLVACADDVARLAVRRHQRQEHDRVERVPVDLPEAVGDERVLLTVDEEAELVDGVERRVSLGGRVVAWARQYA